MNNFYNPYQFIPVDRIAADALDWRDASDIAAPENRFVRHDRWDSDSRSGRITCTLTCRTPLVVGACQHKGSRDRPGEVEPYCHPDETPALPGNSLRGMVASIAETISDSALRVLTGEEEAQWSIRKPVESALTELGILLRDEENGWHIRALPSGNGARLSVPLRGLDKETTYQQQDNSALLHVRLNNGGRFECFVPQPGRNTVSGILYRRGIHRDMPNKKKEVFIQWDGDLNSLVLLPVDDALVEQFNRMLLARHEALEREDNDFPLLPKGYENRDWKQPVVRSGDVVWYRQEKNGRVSELSYSAIWRKPVPGTLHDAFRQAGGENALPWNPERKGLTPAEALFGVVEEQPERHRNARNLASRLRFLDATPVDDIELEGPITLKILASPKPPSPAMYFAAANSGYISKEKLNLRHHKPNGRKFYLPTTDTGNHWESHVTDKDHNWKPHLRVWPIPAGSCFRFQIEFENLSEDELKLLCVSLHPGEGFIHRLGLGKPLGLGQVEVGIDMLELIDRPHRYSAAGLGAPRYQPAPLPADHGRLVRGDKLSLLRQLGTPDRYESDLPVCYPYTVAQGPHAETEGFKWFVANDKPKGPHQFLKKPVAGQTPRYLEAIDEARGKK